MDWFSFSCVRKNIQVRREGERRGIDERREVEKRRGVNYDCAGCSCRGDYFPTDYFSVRWTGFLLAAYSGDKIRREKRGGEEKIGEEERKY
jgi:hypothetical protein